MNPDAAGPTPTDVRSRVQLCGPFVAEIDGHRVDRALHGRQARVTFAFLVLHRHQPTEREVLADALWGGVPPPESSAAINVLISKIRTALGSDLVRGRGALRLALPEPARIDVEVATTSLHRAESRIAQQDWTRAWAAALSARFVSGRRFLPDAETPWADGWRRRLDDVHVRALEAYATACLELGGAELPGSERAALELTTVAPLRETGHLLLMQTLAARGRVPEALTAYEQLRLLLREELGVSPSAPVQDLYAELLG